ncbi:MAG: ABC transporter permease subunit [Deltaproteobacteria bacterium]|nr:ABC transporter permease subunit [Deltaproteobacteria bacterium]
MGRLWAVYLRELKSFFVSPLAYVVIGAFSAITGYSFWNQIQDYQVAMLRFYQAQQFYGAQAGDLLEQLNINRMIIQPTFGGMGFFLLLFAPFISIKLIAEEKKSKTIELLITSPIKLYEIILGKYSAVLTVFFVMLALSFVFPFFIILYGAPDMAPIFSAYLGISLLGASFLAWGFFASSITQSPIVAGVISYAGLFAFWLIEWTGRFLGEPWNDIVSYLSIISHWLNMITGLIDTRDIVYYVSFIFMCLFFVYRVLRSQSWRT